jgi:preprotein translocase subunit SecY
MVNWLHFILQLITIKELRNKIVLTLFLLTVVRLLAHIPLPGLDHQALAQLFASNQLFGLLDLFSGGALAQFSIIFMGVGPYITASIIMQLLGYVIPSLESLQKEGEQGRMKINQYTRVLTVPLSIIQGFGLITLLRGSGVLTEIQPAAIVLLLLTATAGTILLVWLGEIISELGIGNGVSLIITIGILARTPTQIRNAATLVFSGGAVDFLELTPVVVFLAIALLTVIFIVYINEAIRKIPISYARRLRRGGLGSVDTYLPLRLAAAGVIPIIFAISIIIFPGMIARFLAQARSSVIAQMASRIGEFFDPQSFSYGIVYFFLVMAFTYFYTSIVFKPKDVAENLQKQGGFIPGIRPGSETVNYLQSVVNRITLPGAVFLGVVAVLPFLLQAITKNQTFIIGGTGVLIVVSVVLETGRQIKAQILTRSYERY